MRGLLGRLRAGARNLRLGRVGAAVGGAARAVGRRLGIGGGARRGRNAARRATTAY
jgi:hypothetical protein